MAKKIFETELNGRKYYLEAWFGDCRDGFNHFGELTLGFNTIYGESKIHYINRTWERFTFESVLLDTIRNCEDYCKKRIANYAKRLLGKQRMTPQVSAAVDEILNGTRKVEELSRELELLEVCQDFRKQVNEY